MVQSIMTPDLIIAAIAAAYMLGTVAWLVLTHK